MPDYQRQSPLTVLFLAGGYSNCSETNANLPPPPSTELPLLKGALKMQDLKMKDLLEMRQAFVIRYIEHL